jgi:hypothetical protein
VKPGFGSKRTFVPSSEVEEIEHKLRPFIILSLGVGACSAGQMTDGPARKASLFESYLLAHVDTTTKFLLLLPLVFLTSVHYLMRLVIGLDQVGLALLVIGALEVGLTPAGQIQVLHDVIVNSD